MQRLYTYLLRVVNETEQLDRDKVHQLVNEVDPASETSEKSNNPLYLAIKSLNISTKVSDLLIARGFKLNKLSYKLLDDAPIDRIKYALDHVLDLELSNKEYNALHYVIKYRTLPDKPEVLELLLKHGVDVNAENMQGNTPICSAIRRLEKNVVQYLLKQNIQPVVLNSTKTTMLRIPPLQALELGPGLGRLTSREEEMIEILELLIEAGADVNGTTPTMDQTTPLIVAMRNGAIKIAEFFIELGAICSPDGKELVKACEYKYPNILRMFFERGAKPQLAMCQFEQTLFHYALSKCKRTLAQNESEEELTLQLIGILGRSGADINKANERGRTPLMVASTLRQFQALQKHGADLTLKVNGNNLLHSLIGYESSNLKYILEQGVIPVNEKNAQGETPLHIAARCRTCLRIQDTPVVELLLNNGADINAIDNEGNTALMLAVRNEETFELLLQHGADFMVHSNDGKNVMQYLVESPDAKIFIALSKYMTKDQARILLQFYQGNEVKECKESLKVFYTLMTLNIHELIDLGFDVFQCSKLFEKELPAIARGYVHGEFDSSHWDLSTDVHEAPILTLPVESIAAILLMTPVKDFVSFSMTCRHSKLLCDNNTIWKWIAEREGCHKVSKCQNVKKEFALLSLTERNMKQGKYYIRFVKLKESPTVKAQQEENMAYGGYVVSDRLLIDCDLDARLIAVTGNHSEVALIDLDTLIVTQEFSQSDFVAKCDNNFINVKDRYVVAHDRKQGILYVRSFDQPKFDQISLNCKKFDIDGDFVAIISKDNECEVINWRTKEKINQFGNQSQAVLNGHTVAVWNDDRNNTELYDINTKEQLFVSNHQSDTYIFKFGKLIVNTSDFMEFIDVERNIALPLVDSALKNQIKEYAVDEDEQLLLTVDYRGDEVFLWQPFHADVTQRRKKMTSNDCHISSTSKFAINKDFIFAANYPIGISVIDLNTSTLLYTIPLYSVTSIQIIGHYLIAGLLNGSVAVVNFNIGRFE